MNTTRTLHTLNRIGLAAAALILSSAAMAQGAAAVSRNVNQEQRIEQGLQRGELSTGEAARLQREEARIDHQQARALKDGKLTADEQRAITARQNQVSQDIHAAKTNGIKGDPNSASSQRMQAAVQRDVNQQARIEQGLKSGQLTRPEAARLERGQSRLDRRQAHAGQDGHVSARESARIAKAEHHQSRRIFKRKHDARHQPVAG